MMIPKFEEFMTQKYFEDGGQDKDMILDWLNDLPIENIIEYCNAYAIQYHKECKVRGE